MPAFQVDGGNYVSVVLTACILIPIPLVSYYIISLIRWAMSGSTAITELEQQLNENGNPGAEQPDFVEMQSRSQYDEMPGTPSANTPSAVIMTTKAVSEGGDTQNITTFNGNTSGSEQEHDIHSGDGLEK